MIEYVADIESWQHGYGYGAFYIFPPDDVIGPIDELRATYDARSAAICQAHISLSQPVPLPLSENELGELRSKLAAVEPFVVRYGPLRTFPPHPGVVYTISPEEPFWALRSIIHRSSVFAEVELATQAVAPHMTIAEFISLDRTEELLGELAGVVPTGEFVCDRIEYAVPDSDFHFQRTLSVLLGNPG